MVKIKRIQLLQACEESMDTFFEWVDLKTLGIKTF